MVRARGRAVGMPLQGENANADPVPRVLTLGYDGRSLSGSAAHPLKGVGKRQERMRYAKCARS